MSGCGCGGGFPPSVALRIRAAELTAHRAVDHIDAAKAMAEFLRGDLTYDDLDAKSSKSDGSSQVSERSDRARLLGYPVERVLGLTPDSGIVERLAARQVTTVQALVQASEQVIAEAIGVARLESGVQFALSAHGLRLRMSGSDLTDWLFDGNARSQ